MKHIYVTLFNFFFFSAVIFAQAPYAHYPLDGNANDVGANNLDGTITGSPDSTTNRFNQIVKALGFDGVNDYIDLPEDFDFPNRTVTVWFNVSGLPGGNGNVIYNSDHNALQYGNTFVLVYDIGGEPTLHLGSDGSWWKDTTVSFNTWYHAAVVRTPTIAKVFLNGALIDSMPNQTTILSSSGVSNATVGCDRNYNGLTIGKIDDLKIYNVALSDNAIAQNYTSLKDIHEIEQNLMVKAVNGNISYQIDGTFDSEIKSVSLCDVSGKVLSVKTKSLAGNFNDTELPSGTYLVLVEIENGARSVCRKVVVTR